MQFISIILSVLLILQFTCFPLRVSAAGISFTPAAAAGSGGSLQGKIPVNKVGSLVLTDALAIIDGNTIDIEGKTSGSTEKKNLLSGVIIKTDVHVTGNDKNAKVTGIAYFRQGAALRGIDDPDAEELIDLNEGGVVSGHIVAVNRDEVEVEDKNHNRRRLAMADIKTIHSPRAFAFTMFTVGAAAISLGTSFSGTTSKMSFAPTTSVKVAAASTATAQAVSKTTSRKKSGSYQKSGQGHSFLFKAMVVLAVTALVATAIAVPVAVCAANAGHHDSPADVATRTLFVERLTQKSPSAPASSSSSPN